MSYPSNSEDAAQSQVRSFVDRILRLKEEAKSINTDIREIYAEAKGNGFDKTALGKVVAYIEKRNAGAADLAEAEAIFDLYLNAYDSARPSHVHAHAREGRLDTGTAGTSSRVSTPVAPSGNDSGDATPAGTGGEIDRQLISAEVDAPPSLGSPAETATAATDSSPVVAVATHSEPDGCRYRGDCVSHDGNLCRDCANRNARAAA